MKKIFFYTLLFFLTESHSQEIQKINIKDTLLKNIIELQILEYTKADSLFQEKGYIILTADNSTKKIDSTIYNKHIRIRRSYSNILQEYIPFQYYTIINKKVILLNLINNLEIIENQFRPTKNFKKSFRKCLEPTIKIKVSDTSNGKKIKKIFTSTSSIVIHGSVDIYFNEKGYIITKNKY